MNFKSIHLIIFFLLSSICSLAQNGSTVSAKDLNVLLGHWTGKITYLDYSTNKPFTMPADLDIWQIGKTNSFVFANLYPKEPQANSKDTVVISGNGRMMDEKVIRSKRRLPNNQLEIVTEYLHTDGNDNRPAIIRNTYTIGKNIFINRKDVQFVLGSDWIKRSEYAYTRK